MRLRPALATAATILTLLAYSGRVEAVCSTIGLPAGRQVADLMTSLGPLCIELLDDVDEAPGHVDNFLYYLNGDELAGTFFHRVVNNFVFQGGGFFLGPSGVETVPPQPGVTVTNEPCTPDVLVDGDLVCSERGNERYSVALAKTGGDPDSGTTNWFINLADNRPNLDSQNGGFTVFGQVLIGTGSFSTVKRMGATTKALYEDQLWADIGYPDPYDPAPDLPVGGARLYDASAYGCFDPLDLATMVFTDQLPDTPLDDQNEPDTPVPFYYTTSAACGTLIELPDFTPNPGTGACTDLDRLGIRSYLPGPSDQGIPGFPLPLEYVNFTCSQLEESDTERALWRADFKQDFLDNMIFIESAQVVVAVPEPSPGAAAAGALMTVAWLAGCRRRGDERTQESAAGS